MKIIPIPWQEPVAAFFPWADRPWSVFLDSAALQEACGRYSYIGVNPFRTILAVNGRVLIDGRPVDRNPFDALAQELEREHCAVPHSPLPFSGGALGLWSYELGRHLERAPAKHTLPADYPEMAVGFYDVVAGFDLLERQAWVVAARQEAFSAAEAFARQLSGPPPTLPITPWLNVSLRPEIDRNRYRHAVSKIRDYINSGDVFQANFTQRFIAERPPHLDEFAVYRRLRAHNPAPFAAFLRCGNEFTVAGASPERFLSLSTEGVIEARPIKGTRGRSLSPAADAAAAAQLLASEKDRAENLMIADLLRNDIGRVAETGSIHVPILAGLESFTKVHHLVSVIRGRLRSGLGPVDLLRATFPGGSITGAPKVRAMEIIDEMEPAPRGAYCGAIGWIGFDGAMDTSIVIRALVMTKNQIIAQAGGGIVADSQPDAEYAEMMTKIAPALAALSGESLV